MFCVFSEQMLEHWDYPWTSKTYCYTSSQETFTWW